MNMIRLNIVMVILLISLPGLAQNIGIDIGSPVGKLTIRDSLRNALTIQTSDNTKSVGLAFQNSGNAYVWSINRVDTSGNKAHLVFSGGNLNSNVQNLVERLRFTNTGNVGIGVSTPSDLLEVTGTGTAGVIISANEPRITFNNSSANSWSIEVNNMQLKFAEESLGTVLTFDESGAVGVGTSNPQAKLDVNGDFKLGRSSSTLNDIIVHTVTDNIPNILSNDVYYHDFTVPDAALGEAVSVSVSQDFSGSLFIGQARVSAANTVRVKFLNEGNNGQDLPSMDYIFIVIQ